MSFYKNEGLAKRGFQVGMGMGMGMGMGGKAEWE